MRLSEWWRSWLGAYTPPLAVQWSYRYLRSLWVRGTETGRPYCLFAREAELPSGTMRVRPGQIEILDKSALAETLNRILPPQPAPHRITCLVPDAAAMFLILQIEDWPRRTSQKNELVRWHLQQQLQSPLDQFRITWQEIHRQDKNHQVAVLAAWKLFLDQIEDLLESHHMSPGLTLTTSLTVENFLFHHPDLLTRVIQPGRTLNIYWDEERMVVTYFDNGRPVIKRSRALPPSETVAERLEILRAEIQIIFAYLQDYIAGPPPDLAILVGEEAENLLPILQEQSSIPVKSIGNLLTEQDWPEGLAPSATWFPLVAAVDSAGGRA